MLYDSIKVELYDDVMGVYLLRKIESLIILIIYGRMILYKCIYGLIRTT